MYVVFDASLIDRCAVVAAELDVDLMCIGQWE